MTYNFKPGDAVAVHPDGPDGKYKTGVIRVDFGGVRVSVRLDRSRLIRVYAKSDVSPLAEFLELRRKA